MKYKIGIVAGMGVAVSMLLSGCVCDGKVSKVRESWYEPSVFEREGLALARIVTSPYSIVGFTYADCKKFGAAGVLVAPFDLLLTAPAGCLAACADILTGTGELLTFHQFKSVSYPWESFDREKSKTWEEPVVIMYCAALAGAAAGAADALIGGSGSTSSSSYVPSESSGGGGGKARPRVQHSYCHGSGICQICKGKGHVGAGMKCTGCGGTRRCRACHGSGWAN